MQRKTKIKAHEFLVARHRGSVWLRIAGAMMAVVVFFTTYALILPAITMENKTYCGMDEYTHTEACYSAENISSTQLICTPDENADFVIHTHDEACCNEAGELICSLTERETHLHGEECYDETGKLVCERVEAEEHTHTEDCMDENGILLCGKATIISHQHDETCFGTEVTEEISVLTCDISEHTHVDLCYEEPEALTFTYEDDLVSGTVTIPYSDRLPDDLSCTVIALDEESEHYEDMLLSVDDTLSDASKACLDIQLYQLEWESDGKEYTLPESISPALELTVPASFDTSGGAYLQGLVLEESAQAESGGTVIAKLRNALSSIISHDDSEDDVTFDVDLVTLEEQSFSASIDGTSVFGVASLSASKKLSGGFYKRLTSVSDLRKYTFSSYSSNSVSSYNKFVFVFANGMYALEGTTLYNSDTMTVNGETKSGYKGGVWPNNFLYPSFILHKVEVNEIAGNPGYVTITEADAPSGYDTTKKGTVYSPTNTPTQNYIIQNPHPNYSNNTDVFLLRELGADNRAWFYLESGSYGISGGAWSDGIIFEYDDTLNVFHMKTSENGYVTTSIELTDAEYQTIYNDGKYGTNDAVAMMSNKESASIVVYKTLSNTTNGLSYSKYNGDILIYVWVDTTLDVPDVESIENTTQTLLPRQTKPTYSDYVTPEESVSGSDESDEGVDYSYSSDPGTSDIESILGVTDSETVAKLTEGKTTEEAEALLEELAEENYTAQKENDGRIVTDKSVVYGDDSYDAFDSYDYGEFSVTLSALGQEWTISDEDEADEPIDVMFVLDMSGSMTDVASTADKSTPRWKACIEAVNSAMESVLSRNPYNRVGVVTFNGATKTLLPLGRYAIDSATAKKSENGKYAAGFITYDTTATPVYTQTTSEAQYYSIVTNPAICYEKSGEPGKADTEAQGNTDIQKKSAIPASGSATYPQLGLQQAYEEFKKIEDVTVTYEFANGETLTVERQPVIIFLTDGGPTYGTFNYMDPASGPRYGAGTVDWGGMLGYYTILSANYFKNMTSIHYGQTAKFYSIGIGIKSSGYGSYSVEGSATHKTAYYADDAYRRAVINPTEKNIDALQYKPDYSAYNDNSLTVQGMNAAYYEASLLLYNLLTGGNPATYVQNSERSSSDDVEFELWLRTISNPYEKYCYADDSAIYGNFAEEDLENFFDQIVETVQIVNNYGFLLEQDTDVIISDQLGEGMEVKGTPVLSYLGTNYDNAVAVDMGTYTEYTWNVKVNEPTSDVKGTPELDLSVVKAQVYTDADTGDQTVKFIIPDSVMPTLYPDLYKQFYYEELPIRLIYKVGLTEEAFDNADDGDVFYTNKYSADGEALTTVTFTPDSSNPYYKNGKSTTENKKSNTTGTVTYSFTESASYGKMLKAIDSDTPVLVTQKLGNNGKLTVSKPDVTTVKKMWDGVADSDKTDVTAYVFREKEYEDGALSSTEYFSTVTLGNSNSWEQSFRNLEYDGEDSTGAFVWQYYVMESLTDMAKYDVTYTDKEGNAISPEIRSVQVPYGSSYTAYNYVRLYPLSDTVIITNHSKSLTVKKVWADGADTHDPITVDIYRTKTPVTGSSSEGISELLTTLTLSQDNNWTATYDNVPSYGMDYTLFTGVYYDYYVMENYTEGYIASYSDSNGDIDAVTVEVSDTANKTIAIMNVYPAAGSVTVTNNKEIPEVTVNKEWADGNNLHTEDYVRVALIAKILVHKEITDPETGDDITAYETDYLQKDSVVLNSSNAWSYTWTLDDIGKTYYASGSGTTYTVDSYFIAETYSSADGYEPVYYSLDVYNGYTRMERKATIDSVGVIIGDEAAVVGDGTSPAVYDHGTRPPLHTPMQIRSWSCIPQRNTLSLIIPSRIRSPQQAESEHIGIPLAEEHCCSSPTCIFSLSASGEIRAKEV